MNNVDRSSTRVLHQAAVAALKGVMQSSLSLSQSHQYSLRIPSTSGCKQLQKTDSKKRDHPASSLASSRGGKGASSERSRFRM